MLQDTRILCTAVALPQAKPLSWLTLRLATFLVLSNTNPWRSPPPRAPTNSVRGFTLVYPLPTERANNRLGPFVVADRALLEDRLPAGQQTGCDCLAAHGSSSRWLVPHSSHYKRKALGEVLAVGLPCLELPPEHRSVTYAALAAYMTDFYSNHAPGHQLVSVRPCRAVRAVSQTAHG